MDINKVNNISFGAVIPIIATKRAQKSLGQILELSKGKYSLRDATNLYKFHLKDASYIEKDTLVKAAKEGKKISFLLTGRDSTKWVDLMGWGRICDLSHKIDRKPVILNDNSISKMINLLKRTEVNK